MDDAIGLMIVDDHPAMRIGLAAILERVEGLEIVALAGNGAEAVKLFHLHRPDVILMDLRMPVMDGITATEQLLRDSPDARIIILTSYDGDEDIYRALQAGAKSYVLKDTSIETVVDVIHTVHLGGCRLTPEIGAKLAARICRSELTERELEVLREISEGKTNTEIALALKISLGTVKTHVNRIFSKLQVSDRTQALIAGLKRGIIHL